MTDVTKKIREIFRAGRIKRRQHEPGAARYSARELAGKVVLVPCAEKEFYSSSAFVKKIKAGKPDKPPGWSILK